MSFSMGIDSIIYSLFSTHKANETLREMAMMFSLDVGVHSYHTEKQYNRRSSIHFLLYCPYGGSVHTYLAIDGSPFTNGVDISPDRWVNISNHDSCWNESIRSKSFEVFIQMCNSINTDREYDGYKAERPCDMQQLTYPAGLTRDMYQLVNIEQANDEHKNIEYGSNYWKVIKSLAKQ